MFMFRGPASKIGRTPRKSRRFPVRILVVILAGFGVFATNTLRLNLSIALVAMVNETVILAEHGNTTDVCNVPTPLHSNSTVKPVAKDGPFTWDEMTRGLILSAYFWGNVLGQLPGGMVADKFGGKWCFGVGVFISALVSILLPVAAFIDVQFLIILRVICGFAQGMAMPALFSVLAVWIPEEERCRLTSLTYAGVSLGRVVVFPISGLLCESDFMGGWPSVFYVFGGFAVIWSVFWALLIYDKPWADPKVGTTELMHIQVNCEFRPKAFKRKIDWIKIAKSGPIWGLLIAHFAQAWGAHTLLTILPSYLKFAMNFDMKTSGMLNGLPYVLAFVTGLTAGWTADALRNSQRLSTTAVRKLYASIAMLVPMVCLFGITLIQCDKMGLVVLLTVAVAVANINTAGIFTNEMDLSLEIAGTLKAVTSLTGNVAGILAPYAAGLLVLNDISIKEWNKVFYTASAILLVGVIAFLVLGSSEPQQWTIVVDDDEQCYDSLIDDSKTPILSEKETRRYDQDSISHNAEIKTKE